MNTNDMNYNEIITYAPILVDGLAKGLYSGIGTGQTHENLR